MSIASEITRIQVAKANLKTAIEGKGVTVPSSTKLDGYADLVDDIQTGSEPNLQDKSVSYTPTESKQTATVTADSGYDGLDEVSITVDAIDSEYVGSDVPRNTSSDLLTEGATVIAPSGYYENSATKTVQMGTEGTPTASKGAVSNHSVSVTPSVINTAGYIEGGTKTGTAVSVSASELVSGTKSITQNGTEDVTNYASVSVSVPNSYSASDEGKVVSNSALVAQTSDTVTANDTYDTTLINSLTVNVSGGSSIDLSDIKQDISLKNIGGLFKAFEDGTWDSLEYTCVSGTNPITIDFGREIIGFLCYPKSSVSTSVTNEAVRANICIVNDADAETEEQSSSWSAVYPFGKAYTKYGLPRLASASLVNGVFTAVPSYPKNASYHPFKFNNPYIFVYWWEATT